MSAEEGAGSQRSSFPLHLGQEIFHVPCFPGGCTRTNFYGLRVDSKPDFLQPVVRENRHQWAYASTDAANDVVNSEEALGCKV